MKDYAWIIQHVREGADAERAFAQFPVVATVDQLIRLSDDRYLSTLCRRVFRAGLKHSLVDSKWPAFEEAFFGFDPLKLSYMSDEQLEARMQNKALIRHWGKIKSIRVNAMLVHELSQTHGGFGQFIAAWPEDDIIGLWALLKKRGAQLGGQSGAAFLRMVGKDTFRLSPDVVAALKAQGIVDRMPTAQRDLKNVQAAFNTWRQQSGQPLSHISMLLAFTVG
ncbi:MAG: 3-methyladenine DNA glycosylase Tag [Motiliproteus sp.]|jgi:3-methyladenine DNA glycosylase Tag